MQATTTAATNCSHQHGNNDDTAYAAFLGRVQARFLANVQNGGQPLFTTNAADLWAAYLGTFSDPVERQHHNCNACRRFIDRFGGLVTISEDGKTVPAIWNVDDADEQYRPAMAALQAAVSAAQVTGVFLSSERTLGEPKTGVWSHLAVELPKAMVHRDRLQTAGQAMAVKLENFGIIQRALAEFAPAIVDQAVALLDADAMYRAEKVIGPAKFLQQLHQMTAGTKNSRVRRNLVWRAIATAPDGFCHPRSSMVGTLLEDLAAGLSASDVQARFAANMNPLQYQRPQAAPAAGNIAQAEKIVEKLGLAPALRRRFATLDDIQVKLWAPAASKPASEAGGVFGHLKPKASEPKKLSVQGGVMSFAAFIRMLGKAERIEVLVPGHGNFAGLVTACEADAPPLLQWDEPERRNPVSWYLYGGGSSADRWNLVRNSWVDVTAITRQPNEWHDPERYAHQGSGVLFVLDGCRDKIAGGLCLFPETLRSEMREVRSVIEAHSQRQSLEGKEQASACGLIMQGKGGLNNHIKARVTSASLVTEYTIDRLI